MGKIENQTNVIRVNEPILDVSVEKVIILTKKLIFLKRFFLKENYADFNLNQGLKQIITAASITGNLAANLHLKQEQKVEEIKFTFNTLEKSQGKED